VRWGDLDVASADGLRREFTRIAGAIAPGELVVVDASRLTFVDSVGIAALLEGRQTIRRGGGRFRLVAGDALRRLLAISGVSELLVDG
jgi:anti-anti-sigma factor